jgi:hypothetical protein
LVSAPTGISWATIPSRSASPAQQQAEQLNLCMRATAMIDAYCNQVLRATIDVELLHGPGFRLTAHGNGNARAVLSRWPVTQVISGRCAPNSLPYQWTTIPAQFFAPEVPPIGIYGTSVPSAAADGSQAIHIGGGYINWSGGRGAWVLETTYLNGWPHTGITVAAAAGATTLQVDDCTGWAPVTLGGQGATGTIFDSGSQETVTCTAASAQSGPGTLTLASPLVFGHSPGVAVSSLPAQIQWAAINFAAAQALTRGATATTVQSMGGSSAHSKGPEDLSGEAELLCHPFRRTV